jgi:hypothetical protein
MKNNLENYLEAAEGAGQVMAHARLLMKLARLYAEFAPTHLGQASRVANYKAGGIIVIHANSGAVATKLRQMAPSLANEFSKCGAQCSEVQIKVQANEIQSQSRTSIQKPQKPLSKRTCLELGALAGSLPDCPLRSALELLIERAAKQE